MASAPTMPFLSAAPCSRRAAAQVSRDHAGAFQNPDAAVRSPGPRAAAALAPCRHRRRAPLPPAAALADLAGHEDRRVLVGPALESRVKDAFLDTFWGTLAAPRVLDSFRRLQSGREFEQYHEGQGLQRANSYIERLTAVPFPDPRGGAYPWLEAVEAAGQEILEEFLAVTADSEGLAERGNNIWVPAAREDALIYGPKWRTLVLQDRGHWEPTNSLLFPRTTKVFKDMNAPTLEVFFARQEAGTGIASHTDYVNFVQTSHLGLIIPEGEDCWIKVGEHTRQWENGKVITMDTSFMHETNNGTPHDRYVLIMRHWHPEVTPLERVAVTFLFDCFDNPTAEGVKAAQRAANAKLGVGAGAGKAGGKAVAKAAKKKKAASSGGGGFGGGGFGKK